MNDPLQGEGRNMQGDKRNIRNLCIPSIRNGCAALLHTFYCIKQKTKKKQKNGRTYVFLSKGMYCIELFFLSVIIHGWEDESFGSTRVGCVFRSRTKIRRTRGQSHGMGALEW